MKTSLISLSGAIKGQSFELAGTVTLGRNDNSSWRVPDPAVSRRHCRLEYLGDGSYEVVDLGSRSGTSINGKQVKRGLLAPGDLLTIGHTTFFVAARGTGSGERAAGLPDASTFLSTLLESGRLPAMAAARQAAPAHGLLGDSPALKRVLELIAKAAPTPATVLILGESGSGKEVAARAIHASSPRSAKAFVAINCASLSETLLESELFGHEKGAFTGAVGLKPGKVELAADGTLFLDEIGELPPSLQARLLRLLQERSFERVGGIATIAADVRILAATHRDLERDVASGRFREDLFYRLNVISCRMPSLRERPEDLPRLARHFAARHGEALRGKPATIAPAALAALAAHSWPGNVRELANTLERAVVLGSGDTVELHDLPEKLQAPAATAGPGEDPAVAAAGGFQAAVGRFKKALLAQALAATRGNVTRAAEALGLHPNHLHRLLTSLEVR